MKLSPLMVALPPIYGLRLVILPLVTFQCCNSLITRQEKKKISLPLSVTWDWVSGVLAQLFSKKIFAFSFPLLVESTPQPPVVDGLLVVVWHAAPTQGLGKRVWKKEEEENFPRHPEQPQKTSHQRPVQLRTPCHAVRQGLKVKNIHYPRLLLVNR